MSGSNISGAEAPKTDCRYSAPQLVLFTIINEYHVISQHSLPYIYLYSSLNYIQLCIIAVMHNNLPPFLDLVHPCLMLYRTS